MSHKQALSLNVLTAVSLILAAPLALAQVFVGTPAPQQFAAQGQPSTKNGEWVTNGADLQFTMYSPIDQINAQNFDKLEVAWRFKTDAFGPYPEYKLEGTPIMIKGEYLVNCRSAPLVTHSPFLVDGWPSAANCC